MKVQKDGHPQKVAIFYFCLYPYSMLVTFIIFSFMNSLFASVVPLPDNVLFGFEKCKSLTVDLENGRLIEAVASPLDLHCQKTKADKLEFKCTSFDFGSNKKSGEDIYTGGSDLGVAELSSKNGKKIKFLIGKSYASYESISEKKVCAGIFIFEQAALKKKASSPRFDLSN